MGSLLSGVDPQAFPLTGAVGGELPKGIRSGPDPQVLVVLFLPVKIYATGIEIPDI